MLVLICALMSLLQCSLSRETVMRFHMSGDTIAVGLLPGEVSEDAKPTYYYAIQPIQDDLYIVNVELSYLTDDNEKTPAIINIATKFWDDGHSCDSECEIGVFKAFIPSDIDVSKIFKLRLFERLDDGQIYIWPHAYDPINELFIQGEYEGSYRRLEGPMIYDPVTKLFTEAEDGISVILLKGKISKDSKPTYYYGITPFGVNLCLASVELSYFIDDTLVTIPIVPRPREDWEYSDASDYKVFFPDDIDLSKIVKLEFFIKNDDGTISPYPEVYDTKTKLFTKDMKDGDSEIKNEIE